MEDGHDHRIRGISFKEIRMANTIFSYLYPVISSFIEIKMQIKKVASWFNICIIFFFIEYAGLIYIE